MDKEEHLAMASLNSCLEKGGQLMLLHRGKSLRRVVSTDRLAAELYEQCSAFQREERVLQGLPLWVMVSMAGKAFFFIQFMRFYGHLFEEAISRIFSSKIFRLASCIFDLKAF